MSRFHPIILLILIAVAATTLSAQIPEVRFYPLGDLILCKGCGHGGSDFWRLKLRLENVSDSAIVVYGSQYDDDFDFIDQVQYRNPHVCEWQYSYGNSTRRVQWKDMQAHEKVPKVLKPGEWIESDRGIGKFADSTPVRHVTFVAANKSSEPVEIASVAYAKVPDPVSEVPTYRVVTEDCIAQCTASAAAGPTVRGMKLGTTLAEFSSRFPSAKPYSLEEGRYNRKAVTVWESGNDVYSLYVVFLNDKIASMRPEYRSLRGARDRTDFSQLVSEKIGMPNYWPRYRGGWECRDYVVDVISNIDPTIDISTKEYLKFRDAINNEAIRKKQ